MRRVLFTLVLSGLASGWLVGQASHGPWIGLRIWVLDRLSDTPHLLKVKETDWKWEADPSGASDGVWSIRWENCPVPAPGTNPTGEIQVEQLRSTPGSALVAVDTSGRGTLVRPGPFVGIEDGHINVTATLKLSRRYGVVLTRSAGGNYPLGAELQNLTVVYRNGLRQTPEVHYRIEEGVVKPLGTPWPVDDVVVVDGESL